MTAERFSIIIAARSKTHLQGDAMTTMHIPATAVVAFGAIVAGLVTGILSFVTLVSTKENKVSEFRASWIEGLRNEIASYTFAVQDLVRIDGLYSSFKASEFGEKNHVDFQIDHDKHVRPALETAVTSLTKIQLRLNPEHVRDRPDSHEAKLMRAVLLARDHVNEGEYLKAFDACDEVRATAAPLLKSTWDTVKLGESGYRKGRALARWTIGLLFFVVLVCTLGLAIGISRDMFSQ